MNKILFALIASVFSMQVSNAEQITLRIHHFLSSKAPLHGDFLVPFAEELEEKSNGRLNVEIFDSMSLGGRPNDVYDQVVDGAIDIGLVVPGYTPGLFNDTEVFELPFIMKDPIATTKAFSDLVETNLQDTEYADAKILASWVHGPGVIHSETPINSLDDLAGVELRGPTRLVTQTIAELGAIPVGMPLPSVPESLSKGVISGTLLPWEVTPAIRLSELVSNHTEFASKESLYTTAFVLAMNLESFEALPLDLQQIIENSSGTKLSVNATSAMLAADSYGKKIANSLENNIIVLSDQEVDRWKLAAQPVIDKWIATGESKQNLLNDVQILIELYN